MKPNRKIIQIITITLLVAISLFSLVRFYPELKMLIADHPPGEDPVSVWEKRLADIKADLPEQGEVGYLSEWDIAGFNSDIIDQTEEYSMTQYSLAPLIVVKGANEEWIIGNFGDTPPGFKIDDYFHVQIIHNYGWGIYLLKRTAP